ncbi:hypothetical protein [Bacillus sp. FJAT-29937]|uniref:hypothetical protein n=1 Tax=Bacillus sp. FJAT-29937 TaxID=1720553 RepID=UPI00082F8634|nr:hypothetical protein [Bacillus sp. FJAT-29937]
MIRFYLSEACMKLGGHQFPYLQENRGFFIFSDRGSSISEKSSYFCRFSVNNVRCVRLAYQFGSLNENNGFHVRKGFPQLITELFFLIAPSFFCYDIHIMNEGESLWRNES